MMNAKRKYISLHTYLISIQDIFALECSHPHLPLKESERERDFLKPATKVFQSNGIQLILQNAHHVQATYHIL